MSDSQSKDMQPAPTLTGWLRRVTLPVVQAFARGLVRLGFTPDALTVLGLLFAAAAAYFASQGQFVRAGLALVVGGPFDAMDGAVARLTNRVRPFGALLDSTLDRYGEALLFTGLAYYMAERSSTLGVMLAMAALFGSVMVSYLRARSEGLGVDNKVGLFTRVERVAVVVLMLFSGWVMPGLWLLAILTHVTVAQRLFNARKLLEAAGDGSGEAG